MHKHPNGLEVPAKIELSRAHTRYASIDPHQGPNTCKLRLGCPIWLTGALVARNKNQSLGCYQGPGRPKLYCTSHAQQSMSCILKQSTHTEDQEQEAMLSKYRAPPY